MPIEKRCFKKCIECINLTPSSSPTWSRIYMENIYNSQFWSSLEKLVNSSKIVIDRPKNSAHPKYPDFIYPVDYGYLKNTSSMDGCGIDIWKGSGNQGIDGIVCIVDNLKKDSEIKILLNCTKSEKEKILKVQNSGYMSAVLINRK
jgi:inorganic pyrophosphatase